ncbi:MAG TPA: hypothetical protein PKW98_13325, partial [Candidatus Wallbacteria bacterium]|nr:hypothetical protein [Candidatus Wallbacteria bacterium]
MITMYFSKKKKTAKLSLAATAAIFLSVSVFAFNCDLSAAIAQVQGQNSNNFGTFGTYNYTNEVNNGASGIWRSITGSNSGNYVTTNTTAYNQDPFKIKFGTTNANVQLSQTTGGVTGFFKGLFSGGTTSSSVNYNAYNTGYNTYSNVNAYNAYNNLYNSGAITTTAA